MQPGQPRRELAGDLHSTRYAAGLRHAETYLQRAKETVRAAVAARPAALEGNQTASHGLAWIAAYVEALRQLLGWAERLKRRSAFGELEEHILAAGFGEYLAQLSGGIALSQSEIIRPYDLDLDGAELLSSDVQGLTRDGNTHDRRAQIAELIAADSFGSHGIDDDIEQLRIAVRRFVREKIEPEAHGWHLRDELIPDEIVAEMGALGIFGLTVPEDFGGLGMDKLAMCVVSEELSRGYLGVGSIGTRAEIASELIRLGGTIEQMRRYLPGIASGEILPAAVFTEPGAGSDLAALTTQAERDGDVYLIRGSKTWITHAARSDLMTLLARTDPGSSDHRGLSMFLAQKPRGRDGDPFPAKGMWGSEIRVLGYRGMKEYELAFDGFEVPAGALLGETEGAGFHQLMQTFESARIQTASRALGVAQNALELGLSYALGRKQFGKPLYAFPRVHGKLAWMAVETMIARQLTYHAARAKSDGRRCDVEAGMAKLISARVAWANADGALQIHGGNGYSLEFPISRVLCDARILNIFEGSAEIQAHVIARGLLTGRN